MRGLGVLTAVVLTAGPVLGQQPARGLPERLGTRPAVMLLNRPQVQEDLKLTEEQVKQVKEVFQKVKKEIADLQDLEGPTRFDKMAAKFQEADRAAGRVLRPEQGKRLKQLGLQLQGVRALLTPDVARELGLSDEQKRKIKEAQEEARKQGGKLREDAASRTEARKQLAGLMKANTEKVQALLTDEQRAKWKEMLGEPFKGDLGPGGPGGRP
jgi:hypothetical protein